MIFNWRYVQTKSPLYGQVFIIIIFSLFFVAPGKPTDLQVASVRNLTIKLKWERPLTTAGSPDSSVQSYTVSYQATGSGARTLVTASSESAEIGLEDSKQYNIYVKAVRPNQSTWSDVLRVDTKNLGEFELIYSSLK